MQHYSCHLAMIIFHSDGLKDFSCVSAFEAHDIGKVYGGNKFTRKAPVGQMEPRLPKPSY